MPYSHIGNHNRLTIGSVGGSTPNSLSFPAYLETSDIRYVIDSKELPYAPLSFVNSKVHLRTRQTISLKFNVYSQTAVESVANYNKLDDIIDWIKPRYVKTEWQYVPDVANNTGLISVSFAGLQKTDKLGSRGEVLKLHLTNFAYSINKDMGYHSGSSGALIPVAYSLQIEGDILLEFDKTANVTEPSAAIPATTTAATDAGTGGGGGGSTAAPAPSTAANQAANAPVGISFNTVPLNLDGTIDSTFRASIATPRPATQLPSISPATAPAPSTPVSDDPLKRPTVGTGGGNLKIDAPITDFGAYNAQYESIMYGHKRRDFGDLAPNTRTAVIEVLNTHLGDGDTPKAFRKISAIVTR